MTRFYYDRGGVQVTGQELVIHQQRYLLDELHQLRVARGATSRATTVCLAATGLLVLLGGYGWRVSDRTAVPAAAATLLAAVAAVAALVSRRIRPRPFELWAEYRQHTVQLLWSRDERVFNQIRFAVCRARQATVR